MKMLGLYLHIPFCVQKCYYCDFLSAPTDEKTMKAYTDVLCREIKAKSADYQDYLVDTIFIGGGTPSILPVEQMEQICCAIHESYQLKDEIEWTIECNPGTVTEEKLIGYCRGGINRISFGLQSTHNTELKLLGRIHTYEEFLESYACARRAGFQNISVDLMSALPGQTMDDFDVTLQRIIALQPEHISAYSLIIEEGTLFYKRYNEAEMDEDLDREIYRMTEKKLESAGYHHYEISNYAKEGYESRHNVKYWRRDAYLGLGLGASSMVEDCRWHNENKLSVYLNDQKQGETFREKKGNFLDKQDYEELIQKDCMEEFVFLGLRMMEGISQRRFSELFHTTFQEQYGDTAKKQIQEGLLAKSKDGDRLYLTERGIDVSNMVFVDYLKDE